MSAGRLSAGLVVHRRGPAGPEVLLVHPGGPFWRAKRWGSWSIPKGEVEEGEEPPAVAEREFAEELGAAPPPGPRTELGTVTQAGGKRVVAWAVSGDLDPGTVRSNTFTMEWPPRSGVTREFPEVDEARWFTLEEAGRRILAGQRPLLERLAAAEG